MLPKAQEKKNDSLRYESPVPSSEKKSFCDISTTSTAPIKITRSQKKKLKNKIKAKSIVVPKNENSSSVAKPTLRKKICLKLAKIFQDKYSIEKITSQKLALSIESKIRNEYPQMNVNYKKQIKMIFLFLKVFFLILIIHNFIFKRTRNFLMKR